MNQDFNLSCDRVLDHEGLWSNHPKDPGGPTMRGITLATARLYIDPHMTTTQLRGLTVAQARAVYKKQYADTIAFDRLPAGLDYAAFDYSVNSGPGRPNSVLRKLVGQGKGKVDDLTIAALGRRDVATLINAVCDERLSFMRGLKTWSTFGAGWKRRVDEVRDLALKLAAGAVRPVLTAAQAVAPVLGKAQAEMAPATGPAVATGAVVVAGVAAAQQSFHLPFWEEMGLGAFAVIGCAVCAALVLKHFESGATAPAVGTHAIPVA